jgi:hypothetical protein
MAEPKKTFTDLINQSWKAIVAGAGSGIGAAWALLAPIGGTQGMLADGKIDANEVGTLVGTFFIVGVPVALATWAKSNKPAKQERPTPETAAALAAVGVSDAPEHRAE